MIFELDERVVFSVLYCSRRNMGRHFCWRIKRFVPSLVPLLNSAQVNYAKHIVCYVYDHFGRNISGNLLLV